MSVSVAGSGDVSHVAKATQAGTMAMPATTGASPTPIETELYDERIMKSIRRKYPLLKTMSHRTIKQVVSFIKAFLRTENPKDFGSRL